METMGIISEAVTLADVTVKRAYFWRAGGKTERERVRASGRAIDVDGEKQKEKTA